GRLDPDRVGADRQAWGRCRAGERGRRHLEGLPPRARQGRTPRHVRRDLRAHRRDGYPRGVLEADLHHRLDHVEQRGVPGGDARALPRAALRHRRHGDAARGRGGGRAAPRRGEAVRQDRPHAVKEGSMAADAQTRAFNNVARCQAFLEVAQTRMTNRAFATWNVPREHFEMVLEAARHAPSGANAQPWHYIVVTDPAAKQAIGQCFVDEQQHRARLRMGFPTPNYNGVKTTPGLIVIVADFRFVRAFPVLNDGSDLDRRYHQNAERILLQSVAASTMSAQLGAPALGYAVWWITAIGQDDIQKKVKPLLGVPDALAVIDVMCFGPPLKPSYKRWKKRLDQIVSWGRFDPAGMMTEEQIDEWVKTTRHKVMYRDESRGDSWPGWDRSTACRSARWWTTTSTCSVRTRRWCAGSARSWPARRRICGPSTGSPTSSKSRGDPPRCAWPSTSGRRRPPSPTTS